MRRLFLRGSAIVVGLAFVLAMIGTAAGQEAQPSLQIDEMRHDLGEVFEAKLYKHTFVVKNIGDADLRIEKVKPG